jgi:hypothetical protein
MSGSREELQVWKVLPVAVNACPPSGNAMSAATIRDY